MNPSHRYRINSPAVAHEVIEGEVVIIHFDTGNYYGMRGSAVEMWSLLSHGASLGEVRDELLRRFESDANTIENAITEFTSQILAENLVIETDKPGTLPEVSSDSAVKKPFEPPVVEIYSDMQDLLLLDPIHEVDEVGWPREKA